MKYLWRTGALLGALMLSAATPALADHTIRFQADPGSKVKIDGTSTRHDWTVQGSIIGGFLEIQTSNAVDPAKLTAADLFAVKTPPKVEATIPVRSLKSASKSTIMDNFMYEAMNQSAHKSIQYKLTEWSLKEAPKAPGGPAQFNTKGELTVSGVKRIIEMPVTLELLPNNRLKASGEASLKMTDFGIKPPSPPLLGAVLKTGDDVKVSFDWMTSLRSEAK